MASPDLPFKVKSLFDYTSPHADDLNFPADVVITVSALEDDDWYFGDYVDKATGEKKEGIFPKNFVERIVVEVPARPTRSGARKKVEPEVEPELPTGPVAEKAAPPSLFPPPSEKPDPIVMPPPAAKSVEMKPPPPPAELPKQAEASRPLPQKAAAKPPPPPLQAAADKPGLSNKPPPPDKPSSSSFKDRLALFNKGGAAPVTPYNPLKPRQDFVKKPFVPPPPSKNAYVPPPISHVAKPKRDEGQPPPPPVHAEPSAKASAELERDEEENVPKQSLKERIALLQTQQLDPSALTGAKPKPRPKPKKMVNEKNEQQPEDSEITSPPPAPTVPVRKSHDEAREEVGDVEEEDVPPPPRVKRSVDIKREEIADDSSVGDADVSSASIGPSEARVRRTVPAHQSDFGDDEGANDTPDVPDSDDEEEEEIDPELQKKIALRERMMKMSGGMGMHGMFGPPIGIPMGAPAKKKKSTGGKSVAGEEEEEKSPEVPRAPVPVLPFAMPRVQSPPAVEHELEEEEEDQSAQAPAGHKISEDLPADEPVDVEDMKPTEKHPHGPRPMPPRSPPTTHEGNHYTLPVYSGADSN